MYAKIYIYIYIYIEREREREKERGVGIYYLLVIYTLIYFPSHLFRNWIYMNVYEEYKRILIYIDI